MFYLCNIRDVTDGNIFTGQGMKFGQDKGLHLVVNRGSFNQTSEVSILFPKINATKISELARILLMLILSKKSDKLQKI